MEIIYNFINFVLHIDKHLFYICTTYGIWVYAILFFIIFCETGFVITPFLPGDSLLFAVGSLAAINALNFWLALTLLILAAILGDTVNYWIGNYIGPKIFKKEKVRFLNKEYLQRTHNFYEKHGGKTIVIARFLPIIRTFAPFVAGIGSMTYGKFLSYNVFGGMLWVTVFMVAGFFFGSVNFVKNNFSLVILALVVIPAVPAIIEFLRHYISKKNPK